MDDAHYICEYITSARRKLFSALQAKLYSERKYMLEITRGIQLHPSHSDALDNLNPEPSSACNVGQFKFS